MNPIEACDTLAAHPDDPEAWSSGVTDLYLSSEAVIEACEKAKKLDPKSPRLMFQLARGYIKVGSMEPAIENMVAAAKLGHGGALAYMGDVLLSGDYGIEMDVFGAKELYTKAAAAGFEPAKKILAEFEDYTQQNAQAEKEEKSGKSGGDGGRMPANAPYAEEAIIAAITSKRFFDVPGDDSWVKAYLIEVLDTIRQECGKHISSNDIDKMRRRLETVDLDFSFMSPGGKMAALAAAYKEATALQRAGLPQDYIDPTEKAQIEENIRSSIEKGVYDGMVAKSKMSCQSVSMASFVSNARAFIEDIGFNRPTTREIWSTCNTLSNSSNSAQGQEFCRCVTQNIVTRVDVTRKQWGLVTKDYRAFYNEVLLKNGSNNQKHGDCFIS